MPPKKQTEGLVVVVDVGCTMVAPPHPPIHLAKIALQALIQSVILYRSKSLLGIVLFGTVESNNSVGYENVCELVPLQPPSISALKKMAEVCVVVIILNEFPLYSLSIVVFGVYLLS
jgi:hypothetical protein